MRTTSTSARRSVQAARQQRARIWLSAIAGDQDDGAARSVGRHGRALAGRSRAGAREARALGLSHGRDVPAPRRGRARGVQPGTPESELAGRGTSTPGASPQEASLRFAAASLREGFVAPSLKLAVFPEHRLLRRRRAERGGADRGARGGRSGARRGALRSFTELRAGDVVVHEDHGVARFAGFETRTVADVTRDYLYLEYQGDDKRLRPHRPAGEDLTLRRRGRRAARRCASSAARAGRR